jgi:hypothetical protein
MLINDCLLSIIFYNASGFCNVVIFGNNKFVHQKDGCPYLQVKIRRDAYEKDFLYLDLLFGKLLYYLRLTFIIVFSFHF